MSDLNQLLKQIAQDEELNTAFTDPIDFSRVFLDTEPRWYQKLVLSHDGNNKVIRCGRRAGKTYTMIMKALFQSITEKNQEVLVVAPLGVQVTEIFQELRTFVNQNEILSNMVTRDVKSPHTLEFMNGSRILGLSAGTSSGSSARNVRGQGADLIILDECDFLNESDLNSIMGTQLGDVESVEIWSASTPSGARSMFYRWCKRAKTTYTVDNTEDLNPIKKKREHDSNNWVQFHFPAQVNPNWDEKSEEKVQDEFTELGYIHEVLAEFGDTEAGVYKNEYIDKAACDYSYEDYKNRDSLPRTVRIIGVDWDRKVPTQIVVSEFNPTENKIQLIDRIEIEPSEFIFDNAVNKIVELNEKYKPNYIYVDRGYGEYQVETLQKKIGKKVKGISFSEKLEHEDPFTGETDKKEVDHFMVTQTAILLEREQLMFSKYDQDFLDELRNFRIERYTSRGKPVYNDDNEHSHDAFALTVLGFNQEFPDLTDLLVNFKPVNDFEVVDKKLTDIGNILAEEKEKDKNNYGFSREQAEDMEDEPHYVKHMKSIEFARDGKSSFGKKRSTWGSRGRGSKSPPGRRSF